MVKVVFARIHDLYGLLGKLKSSGFEIEPGTHAVLPDNSEIEEMRVVSRGRVVGIVVAHYISQYYGVIADNRDKSDDELLHLLLEAKYGGNKWKTPIEPVAIISDDKRLLELVEQYSDDYPSEKAREYYNKYREENPLSEKMFSGLIARVLEKFTDSQ